MVEISSDLVADRPPDRQVMQAARLLSDPRVRMAELVRVTGTGERKLRRQFDTAVGYGPKTLQRVLRFRSFLHHARKADGEIELAELAFRLGYADQSHLSQETTLLAGMPPRALARAIA